MIAKRVICSAIKKFNSLQDKYKKQHFIPLSLGERAEHNTFEHVRKLEQNTHSSGTMYLLVNTDVQVGILWTLLEIPFQDSKTLHQHLF